MPAKLSTGLELILCACEKELYIILTDNDELVCAHVWAMQDRSTEILAPDLKQILKLSGHTVPEIRRIGCVSGPGSFTGTRLVLATAAALRRGSGAQIASLDYMSALATTIAHTKDVPYGHTIWILTHARRNLVHARPFMSYGPAMPPEPLAEVQLMSCAQAVQAVIRTAQDSRSLVYVAGSSLTRDPEVLAGLEAENTDRLVPCMTRRPSVDGLIMLSRDAEFVEKDVEPVYVRPCDAIENLPSLSERMGRNAEQSVRELDRLLSRTPDDQVGL